MLRDLGRPGALWLAATQTGVFELLKSHWPEPWSGRSTVHCGHNKQGRHNLRQVGLSYVLDGIHGLLLCHHVYPGNEPDTEEVANSMPRFLNFLDENLIARNTVTLVFDKESAALYSTLALDQSGMGWI